jgi:hypothetical protein
VVHFPAVQTIRITGLQIGGNLEDVFDETRLQPLKTVQDLELPAGLDVKQLKSAAYHFPDLQKLTIGGQSLKSMRAVFSLWPSLKKLYMCAPLIAENNEESAKQQWILDSLLTGYTLDELQKAPKGFVLDSTVSNIGKLKGNPWILHVVKDDC